MAGVAIVFNGILPSGGGLMLGSAGRLAATTVLANRQPAGRTTPPRSPRLATCLLTKWPPNMVFRETTENTAPLHQFLGLDYGSVQVLASVDGCSLPPALSESRSARLCSSSSSLLQQFVALRSPTHTNRLRGHLPIHEPAGHRERQRRLRFVCGALITGIVMPAER